MKWGQLNLLHDNQHIILINLYIKSHISANKKTVSKPNATVIHHYINPISNRKMDLIFI